MDLSGVFFRELNEPLKPVLSPCRVCYIAAEQGAAAVELEIEIAAFGFRPDKELNTAVLADRIP